jgi:uncharacterized protein (DUF885 family)
MSPVFGAWLDGFFDAYFRQRPVNATFIGVHAFDDRLPDLSETGQANNAAESATLLSRLRALPDETLNTGLQLDRQLAEAFLEIAAWEATSAQYAWGNPSLFTGEAVFGVLSLLLRPFAPLPERLELTAARLAAIPRLLDDGQAVVHDAPAAWSLRARRECGGAQVLFQTGLDQLVHAANISHPSLHLAAREAQAALARFDTFVETELLPAATDRYACGAEVFELLLRRAHFFGGGADELERMALERIAEEEAAIAAGGPPLESTQPSSYLARFSDLWSAARDLAEQQDLLTFPDWPVRYVEQPMWVRAAAPAFYFLPYRAPAPFDVTPVVDYFVPTTADDSTIKLNHVVHHGSLGHHVQNWHAARAESRIGQVAAVDCASRIAMLCGGTLAEGWACYATDLADEAGFLTPAESFAQHAARLRMAARALVDIQLHQGRLTLDEAARVYSERVGMLPPVALAEAVKNSLFPGSACMYLAGWDGIWQLRRRLHHGGTSLRQIHDRLLSFGSVPVSLVGRAMHEPGEVPALANR